MHPRLGEWFGITVTGYGAGLVLAAPVCLITMALLLRRRGCNLVAAVDVSTLALIGYWPGARLLYLLVSGRGAGGFPAPNAPGAWGGQIAFGLLWAAYFSVSRTPRTALSDATAVAWAALTVPVKLGCFLAGCCFGAPTSLPWGVRFPAMSYCATPGISIHPTQLYDAGAALAIALALLVTFLRRAQEGRLLLWFGVAYAATKFASETCRGDRRFPIAGTMTASMGIEMVVALICFGLLIRPASWARIVRKETRAVPEGRGSGRVFGIESAIAALAFLAAALTGAGRVWPFRSFAAYVAVFLVAQLLLARGVGSARLRDGGGGFPRVGRLFARGLIQALAALTLLQLLRPLFDRAGGTAGDSAAETRLVFRPTADS
jgi:phosphatidylglycerol:prolipoprotein diacylglycerol transferase